METRPLGKQLINKVYYNHTTVFLNGIYSYCDITVLIIMTDFLHNERLILAKYL